MTDIQIRECFGIASSAPDRVLRNDEEILQSIKNNIGFTKIFDAEENTDKFIPKSVIEDIKAEIENTKYAHYGQLKGTKNCLADGLDKALEIIDKHIGKENT